MPEFKNKMSDAFNVAMSSAPIDFWPELEDSEVQIIYVKTIRDTIKQSTDVLESLVERHNYYKDPIDADALMRQVQALRKILPLLD